MASNEAQIDSPQVSTGPKQFIVTTNELAGLIGKSPTTIREFIVAGMPKIQHNTFNLVDALKWYHTHLEEKYRGRYADLDLEAEQTRKTKAEADLKEIQLAVKRGSLAPIELVIAEWDRIISSMKARLLGIPSVIASQSPGPVKAQMKAIAEQEINQALYELSRTDGRPTGNHRPGEADGGSQESLEDADSPASKTHRKRVGRRKAVHPSRGKRRRHVKVANVAG